VRLVTIMHTETEATFRLFQLISPSLPTGAFSYSQGLEWAVENGMVTDQPSLEQWLRSYMHTSFSELEIPILKRLYSACREDNLQRFMYWCDYLLASRETSELRLEEKNRGRAMAKLLADLDLVTNDQWFAAIQSSQAAGYALAAVKWQINVREACLGYLWSWLENMVMAAVKIIPLGQTTGQRVLCSFSEEGSRIVTAGLAKNDDEIMGSCPAFALSSCLHETQYTRLFRS
jgi:urease accessory protein